MLRRRFNRSQKISPQTLVWLVISLLVATLAHFSVLSIILVGFIACLVIFRILVARGRIKEAGRWTRVAVIAFGIGLFVLTNRLQFTVELAVSFYVLAYGMKMMELKSSRDAYIFAFMSMFLLTLGLLFSQSIFISLYVFASLGLCLLTLMAINAPIDASLLKRSVG